MNKNLKNLINAKSKRERVAPNGKTIERHKDYKLRAKAQHTKEDQMRELNRLAEARNPDEFHIDMLKYRLDAKGMIGRKNRSYELLKDEDKNKMDYGNLGHLKYRKKKELHRVDKAREQLESLSVSAHQGPRTKILLLSEDEEVPDLPDSHDYSAERLRAGPLPEIDYQAAQAKLDKLSQEFLEAQSKVAEISNIEDEIEARAYRRWARKNPQKVGARQT